MTQLFGRINLLSQSVIYLANAALFFCLSPSQTELCQHLVDHEGTCHPLGLQHLVHLGSGIVSDQFIADVLNIGIRVGDLLVGQQNVFTLLDCINGYTTTEILNKDSAPFCCECQSRQSATKGTSFSRVPHYLMVHLKRFTPDGTKSHVPVVINERLNLTGQDYVLLSVLLHAGSESFGHNYAMHRHRSTNKGFSSDYAKTKLEEDLCLRL